MQRLQIYEVKYRKDDFGYGVHTILVAVSADTPFNRVAFEAEELIKEIHCKRTPDWRYIITSIERKETTYRYG